MGRTFMRNLEKARFRLSPTLVITMTIFIDLTGFGMIIPLLPFIVTAYQAGPAALGILVTSFSMVQFISSPILGRVSDKVGRRPVLLLSVLTSAASFILFAIADSFPLLLLSRIIAGLATEAAVAQAYIADITSEKERAKGMGRVGAAVGAGFIIGPAIGGFLSVYGYSAPGFAAAALALLNFLFVFLFLPESIVKKQPEMLDGGRSKGSYLHRMVNALTKPLMGSVYTIFFILTLAFSTIPVIIPLLGIAFYNFGSIEMSYVFIYIGLIQILLQGFIIGRLEKNVGEEKLIAFGPLIMTLGIFVMPLIPNIAVFLVSLGILAFGNGIMQTAVPSFISKRTLENGQGGTLGVVQSLSSIARVPGPIIGGVTIEFAGLAAPFFLSAALLTVAFVLGCKVFHA
jgi:predicted MFS family arabinose efflux permease